MTRPIRFLIVVPAVAAALVVASGCGDDSPPPAANRAPTVSLTAAPPAGSETHYRVDLAWSGSDPDGTILRYEYAVDPPAAFTGSEIVDGGDGLTGTVVETDDGPVTRVEKTVDGEVVSFDWVHIDATEKTCAFSAAEPDTNDTGGTRFTGMHAFYVRAVDDEEAVSPADGVAFTATTLAPESELVFPADRIVIAPERVMVRFAGSDPDGGPGGDERIRFEIKLAGLGERPPLLVLQSPPEEVAALPEASPWMAVDPGADEYPWTFPLRGTYAVFVRAVDEAGARDPFLYWGRNAAVLQTVLQPSAPILTLRGHGAEVVSTGAATDLIDVGVGQALHFEWTATAEHYGGEVDAFRWSWVGAPETGEPVWSPWGPGTSTPSGLSADQPGLGANLSVQARDRTGSVSTATLLVRAVDLPRDRPLLVVDDFKDGVWPRDDHHDAFWWDRITMSGRVDEIVPEALLYDTFGEDDVEYFLPIPPGLEFLGRYRSIVWNVAGTGTNGLTGLLRTGPLNHHLDVVMATGTDVWLTGTYSVAATAPTPAGGADLGYPLGLSMGDWAWDWLRMRGAILNNGYGNGAVDGMLQVDPWPGAPAIWPGMEVDKEKMNPALRETFGIGGVDVVGTYPRPNRPGRASQPPGVFEPLYGLGAVGPLQNGKTSSFHGQLAAYRWHDPDPAAQDGRIVWFGFPMYYFHDNQAQAVFNGVLDWFREDDPAARP